MRIRLALVLAAVLTMPAVAPATAEPGSWVDAPDKLPRAARGDRTKNLDFLFEALKVAPDADSAKLVESRIWALWFASGSDTADLLMSRVKTANDEKDTKLALHRSQYRQVMALVRSWTHRPGSTADGYRPSRHAAPSARQVCGHGDFDSRGSPCSARCVG